MRNTNCIILCGGQNVRWEGHLGVTRKHLVTIEGETLLDRTVRQVLFRGPDRLIVVVNKEDIELYRSSLTSSVELFGVDSHTSDETEAQKFLSSRELWNKAGRTIVLMGDVWFSDKAMNAIFEAGFDEWTAFGRKGGSRFTGCPHGELFAQKFTDQKEHAANLELLDRMYRDGTCARIGSGWAHYQLMIGADPNEHTVGPRFVEIDDFTEDLDSPRDHASWVRGRETFKRIDRKRRDATAL